MIKIALALLLAATTTAAFPASNEQLDKKVGGSFFSADKELSRQYNKLGYYLDKATINDIGVNAVSEEKKVEQTVQHSQPIPAEQPPSTIQITGITTGASAPPQAAPTNNTPFNPARPGTMFARLIDDIFQIPITVLQSVARLITNPFQRKTPEVVATIS